MAFEILEKLGTHQRIEPDTISVNRTGILFGNAIDLRKYPYVEIWLDRDANQVGFKGSSNSVTGYRVKLEKNRYGERCRISSKHSLLFPFGKYKARKMKDMYVIEVTEIAEPQEQPEQIR